MGGGGIISTSMSSFPHLRYPRPGRGIAPSQPGGRGAFSLLPQAVVEKM